MALDARQRRALIARGHHLKAAVTVSGDRIEDSAVEHVRLLLEKHELAKVRVRTDDRVECAQAMDALAQAVPCEIVSRVGRVVLLYRPKQVE
jgi:RNA-binding protein